MYYQDKQNEAKERVDSIRHDKDEEIHKLRDDMDAMRRDFQRQMRDKVHTHTHTHTGDKFAPTREIPCTRAHELPLA